MTQAISRILRDHTPSRLRTWEVALVIFLATAVYGGVMGSFGGWRVAQICISAIKVPMLLGVSFVLTMPSFFILNTLLGLRGDFRLVLRALSSAQAGLSITLASLSPFVALWYASTVNYSWAILFNGGMFAIATITGQVFIRRHFAPLIKRNPRHKTLLRLWSVVYALIAIQMAWVIRPFVGFPGEPVTFFRQGAWGNAYVVIWNML